MTYNFYVSPRWGGYYEAVKELLEKDEKITDKDPVFQHILDLEGCSYDELYTILPKISKEDQNKLNSPLLDVLILYSNVSLFNAYMGENALRFLLSKKELTLEEFENCLKICAKAADVEMVKVLLNLSRNYAAEFTANMHYWSSIDIISGKNLEIIKLCEKYGINFDKLVHANIIEYSSVEIFQYFLPHFPILERKLHYYFDDCCRYNNTDIFIFLWETYTHVDIEIQFRLAVNSGSLGIVRYLTSKGAYFIVDIDAVKNHVEMAKFLIKNNMLILNLDRDIQSPCYDGHTEMVIFLLEKGAKITKYAFGCAARTLNFELVNLFLKEKLPQETIDEGFMMTCIQHAEHTGVKMLELLVKNGANVHMENEEPLRKAIYCRKYDLIDFLLKHGARVEKLLRK